MEPIVEYRLSGELGFMNTELRNILLTFGPGVNGLVLKRIYVRASVMDVCVMRRVCNVSEGTIQIGLDKINLHVILFSREDIAVY